MLKNLRCSMEIVFTMNKFNFQSAKSTLGLDIELSELMWYCKLSLSKQLHMLFLKDFSLSSSF